LTSGVETAAANASPGGASRDRVAVVTGAARGIGRAIAEGLGAAGLRVAAVDLLECDETVAAMAAASIAAGTLDDAELDRVVATQPVPRAGRPDDVVGLVRFLVCEEAAMVSGQFIAADGGMTRR
jgi:meso-butanediol dehydrogenase/(S,S)-butanediol dehydrogenase/diacetyl reductase